LSLRVFFSQTNDNVKELAFDIDQVNSLFHWTYTVDETKQQQHHNLEIKHKASPLRYILNKRRQQETKRTYDKGV